MLRRTDCIQYLNVIDVVAVPRSVEELVAESQNQDVLNHLLTEVVVDAENLLLLPIGLQSLLEVARALKVLTEGLLDLRGKKDGYQYEAHSVPASRMNSQ
jgi:hypothetical protein